MVKVYPIWTIKFLSLERPSGAEWDQREAQALRSWGLDGPEDDDGGYWIDPATIPALAQAKPNGSQSA